MEPSRLVPWTLLIAAVGCGTGPSPSPRTQVEIPWADLWPGLARPGAVVAVDDAAFPVQRPSDEALGALRRAETAWRARDDEGFASAGRTVADDPVATFWLARMLIRDTLFLRRQMGDDAAALVGEPAWRRPFDALTALGAAAVPCVVLDLLRQRSADLRDLGAELLHAMGPAALPAWERVASVPDPAVRRYVVQALRGWDDPRSGALLDRARLEQVACAAASTTAQAALGAWQEGGTEHVMAYDGACDPSYLGACAKPCSQLRSTCATLARSLL